MLLIKTQRFLTSRRPFGLTGSSLICCVCPWLVSTWWQALHILAFLPSSHGSGCLYSEHLLQNTWNIHTPHCVLVTISAFTAPQNLQLCLCFRIENWVAHSVHFWTFSSFCMWGCFFPISESSGLRISLPTLREDFLVYKLLIARKRYSNHSSFSCLVAVYSSTDLWSSRT